MLQWDFQNQVVLVVGGTSGINRGIATGFAEHGAKVGVISRSADKVNDTVNALLTAGASAAQGETADVRDFAALDTAVTRLAEAFGPFDTVVSGAAGNFPALATAMSANGFKAVMDIDLLGTYHVMRVVYPHLRRPGASIINISAPQAAVAMVGQVHVCAAKAGVDMISKTLAMEWGCEGVRVNSIIPGPIAGTEGMKRLAPSEELLEACRQSVPLRRLGVAQDIANACLFLASPFASFINGAVLPVDGGWVQGGYAAMGVSMEPLLRAMAKQSPDRKDS